VSGDCLPCKDSTGSPYAVLLLFLFLLLIVAPPAYFIWKKRKAIRRRLGKGQQYEVGSQASPQTVSLGDDVVFVVF
jgi:hypothetical protein